MKFSGLKLMLGAASLATLLSSSAALADGFWGGVSATITGTTDYRFRGISQSDNKPAIQGSLDWAGDSGFYIGAWASSIDFNDDGFTADGDTSVEVDLYAGKHWDLGNDLDLNTEVIYYAYPDYDSLPGAPDYNYFEGLLALSKTWDKLTLTGTVAYSPEFFGETGNAWYLSGNASYAINDWLSASGTIGEQWVDDVDSIPGSGYPYTHWDVGLTAVWKGFKLDARYIDTSLNDSQCVDWCDGAVVGSLSYTIAFGGGE